MPYSINKFPNLRAEMARKKITVQDIANHLGIHRSTTSMKLSGKYEFTLSEALKIGTLFPRIDWRKRFQQEE